ncbi:MAG: hypothetical protein KF690_04085 [Bacteroidetes bacterium]|nr:hypothetical protein [Bacteroidota bacterium]
MEQEKEWNTFRFSLSLIDSPERISWLLEHPLLHSSDAVAFALLAERVQRELDTLVTATQLPGWPPEENDNF